MKLTLELEDQIVTVENDGLTTYDYYDMCRTLAHAFQWPKDSIEQLFSWEYDPKERIEKPVNNLTNNIN